MSMATNTTNQVGLVRGIYSYKTKCRGILYLPYQYQYFKI